MAKGNKSLEQKMQKLIHKRTVPLGNKAVKQQKQLPAYTNRPINNQMAN